MQTLTVRQPWADLIVRGHKTEEWRGWSTSYRGTILIHAGLVAESSVYTLLKRTVADPLGVLVGTATLDHVEQCRGGGFVWLLSDAHYATTPVEARGMPGLFTVDDALIGRLGLVRGLVRDPDLAYEEWGATPPHPTPLADMRRYAAQLEGLVHPLPPQRTLMGYDLQIILDDHDV